MPTIFGCCGMGEWNYIESLFHLLSTHPSTQFIGDPRIDNCQQDNSEPDAPILVKAEIVREKHLELPEK